MEKIQMLLEMQPMLD